MKETIKRAFIKLPAPVKVTVLSNVKPRSMTIEPTNICNIKCPFCATTTGLERPIGQMSIENFRYIIDQVKPYIQQVWIYFMGEPLLNKDLFKMVRYCLAFGIRPHFITNGMLIHKHVDEFIDSGLPGFRVAIDGFNKETQEKYRVGSSFDKIIEGIKALVKRKIERGSATPRIAIQSLAFSYNDANKIRALADELGVEAVKIKAPRLSDQLVEPDQDVIKEFMPSDEKYIRVDGLNTVPFVRDAGYCHYMRNPIVTWDGQVLPCCFDFRGWEPLGNIFEDDLLSILRGKRGREVLSKYFDKSLSICEHCTAT